MTVKEAAPRYRRINYPSLDERLDQGRTARDRTPPYSHAGWSQAADRPDPVGLLEEQDRSREPDPVPVRHGRMMVSPFTFYRGTARIMAAERAGTPVAGLGVQVCGDAHLSNFGMFASPEQWLLFDLNDFDETLPGPFEYDVKRMTASFLIAGPNNGFARADVRAAALASVTAHREATAGFALLPRWRSGTRACQAKIRRGGTAGKKKQPGKWPGEHGRTWRRHAPATAYRRCPNSVKWLAGSTGSSASRRSSCRPAIWPARSACPRTRSFWRSMICSAHTGPPCYWCQLRDMKGSALVELVAPVTLAYYARLCGWTLARAHPRSADPVATAEYLAGDDAFDQSSTDFRERYADQNEQDNEEFGKAVRSGRLEVAQSV